LEEGDTVPNVETGNSFADLEERDAITDVEEGNSRPDVEKVVELRLR